MRALSLLIAAALVFNLTACSQNPVTGKNQFSLVSASDEVAIGNQQYQPSQQQQGGLYLVDPELQLYVATIGKRLAAVSDRPNLPYEFVVLNNDVPNAWALPGGKIAVNRGLLLLLDDEAQLAAVLGHEIVHAAARHGAAQMTQQQILGIGVQLTGAVTGDNQYGELINMGANLSAGAFQAKYGRSQELESDHYGMEYMARAGYEPQAAVELQKTFVELSKGRSHDFVSALMASHPPSQERVDKNRARAAQLKPGKRNREAYQAAIKQIKADKSAYDADTKAKQALTNKDLTGALNLVNTAIAKQPEEGLFYITKGQILLAQQNNIGATTAFSSATQKSPEYFMGYLGLGLAQKNQRQWNKARSALTKSLHILQTQPTVYYLGEVELGSGNKDKAISYFQAVQEAGGELGQAAQAQLQKLIPPPAS